MEIGPVVKYVELHPTNACIFDCPWCTYKDRTRGEALSLDLIDRVLGLKPMFVLICGGGDPTSYSMLDRGKDPAQVVDLVGLLSRIRERLPESEIMVGTHAGGCMSEDLLNAIAEVSHVGISLGAAYEVRLRQPAALPRTIQNIARIVARRTAKRTKDGKARGTYVGSTFTRESWRTLFEMARLLFEELGHHCETACDLKITFGATSIADDSCPRDPYISSRLTDDDRAAWSHELKRVEKLDPDFSQFLHTRTRLGSPPSDRKPDAGIKQCGMVGNYVLAAADGNYYPCCVMAAQCVCSLGRIEDMTPEALARSRHEFHDCRTPPKCAMGCRVRSNTLMGPKAWPKTA